MDVPTLGFSPGRAPTSRWSPPCSSSRRSLPGRAGRIGPTRTPDAGLARAPALAARTLESPKDRPVGRRHVIAASPVTTFIGAGPSRASAAFGAAKLFEGPQRYGVVQDLEEWAREQYFVSGAGDADRRRRADGRLPRPGCGAARRDGLHRARPRSLSATSSTTTRPGIAAIRLPVSAWAGRGPVRRC